jgi:hypothetical protein
VGVAREGLYRTDIPRAVLVANFFSDLHYLPQWYSADGLEATGFYRGPAHRPVLAGIRTTSPGIVNVLTKESL